MVPNPIIIQIFTFLCVLVYIYAGFQKIINFKETTDTISSKIKFLSKYAFIITILFILIEILFPLLITIFPGSNLSNILCYILILYMVLVLFIFPNHVFLKNQSIPFFIRLSMIGTLLLITTIDNK